MKKTIIVLLALIAIARVAEAAEFTGSFAEVKARSAEVGKPILADFFTDW